MSKSESKSKTLAHPAYASGDFTPRHDSEGKAPEGSVQGEAQKLLEDQEEQQELADEQKVSFAKQNQQPASNTGTSKAGSSNTATNTPARRTSQPSRRR